MAQDKCCWGGAGGLAGNRPAWPPRSAYGEPAARNRGGAPFTCRKWVLRTGPRRSVLPPPRAERPSEGWYSRGRMQNKMHKTKRKRWRACHLHLATRGGRGGRPAWPARPIPLRRPPTTRACWACVGGQFWHRARRLVAQIDRRCGQRGPDAWPLRRTRATAPPNCALGERTPAITDAVAWSGQRANPAVCLDRSIGAVEQKSPLRVTGPTKLQTT